MAGDEWRRATIEEIAERVAMGPFGSSIKVETFVPFGVPVISGQHLRGSKVDDRHGYRFVTEEHADRLKNANVVRGDVIFTHAGNIGQVAYIPKSAAFERYVISQRQFYMRCDLSKVIPEFVVAYFKTREGQHQLLANTSQVGVPSIAQPVTYLRTLEIPLPPLHEQRAIAHILGTLDDKIELNRRMSETLEAMARALFKSWFIDFDPVRAKAEGRDPGLPKPIADLFPSRLVDSERGEIPAGWEVCSLGDVADLDKGLSYKGAGLVGEGGLPLVNLGCFAGDGRFEVANIKRYVGEYRQRHLVRAGDLLIANTDITQKRVVIGSPALVPALTGEREYIFSHHVFAVRFKAGREHWKSYAYFSLLRPEFREVAEGYATGTTVLALPRDGVLCHRLVLPGHRVLAAFERHTAALRLRAQVARCESAALAELIDTLLPELVVGRRRAQCAQVTD